MFTARACLLLATTMLLGLPSAEVLAGRAPVRARTSVQRNRARAKANAKAGARLRRGTKTMMPKRLGEGFFNRVYRSNDGKWVIKKLLPKIAGVRKVSAKRRDEMAKTTVTALELLRKDGIPVPKAFIPKGKKGVVVQEFSDGIPFSKLQGKAKFEASKNLMKLFGQGKRVAKAAGAGDSWYIDTNRENVFFHKDGSVKVWFDPVVPTSGAEVTKAIKARERLAK